MDEIPAGRLVERYRRARRDPTLAVLEGFHVLKHALRFGAEILEAVSPSPDRLIDLARNLAPDLEAWFAAGHVARIPDDVFRQLAPRPPATGVIGLAARPAIRPDAVLASPGDAPVVLLDRPARLGNVGAVVRVAAAAGAAGVLTTGFHDPWHPESLRGSAGLHFALPVARIDELERSGRPLVALDPDGEPLTAGGLPARAVLAFGSERKGLDPGLLVAADARVALAMRPGVSSLNLATAVAAALYLGWMGAGGRAGSGRVDNVSGAV
ncbi:MAG TPA: TrmH family RNA methyltransferase [Longimicrobiales bacterium]|nr:TrmH family RNA methyltransferase [Longimicrobiales bacterium]